MAVTAAGTQRLLVHIVTAMTGYAGCLQFFLVGCTLVAGHAAGISMSTEQRKLRFLCMVELRLIPGLGRVTGLAIGSVPAMVRVVTAMTINASLARGFLEIVSGMAGLAGKSPVPCSQRESGFLRMIEDLFFPFARLMTFFAARTALPLVRIVDPVTRDAGRGRVFIALSGMTQAAFNLVMGARQRIALLGGFGVIKLDLLPGNYVVTANAVLAKGFLVYVLLSMATDAGGRRIAMLFLRLVTIVARSVLVRAL